MKIWFYFLQLNAAGLSVATNCTDIDSTLLETIYSRLDFYDTIANAESSILSVYPELKQALPIHLCAWMNNKVLNNCTDSQTYNGSVRETLNNFCQNKQCNPQLCLLNPEP